MHFSTHEVLSLLYCVFAGILYCCCNRVSLLVWNSFSFVALLATDLLYVESSKSKVGLNIRHQKVGFHATPTIYAL